jgi:GMP synthase (glutamine-hydrolysing)
MEEEVGAVKRAVALRHISFEDLGTLEPVLRERGYEVRYVEPWGEDLKDQDALAADLLIVLGGPIGAFDEELYPFLSQELELVRRSLQRQQPLLGICLGAQLIARALGAKVYSMGAKEIGFGALELTKEGEESPLVYIRDTPVLHWHGDQFDIPDGALRLAGTRIGANQAFSLGARVLGLQFHVEADVRKIERWLVGHACELNHAGIDPKQLRRETSALQDQLSLGSRAMFSAWLDGL